MRAPYCTSTTCWSDINWFRSCLRSLRDTWLGFARCSTDRQDLGVAEDRIYTDHGLSDASRARPDLDGNLPFH